MNRHSAASRARSRRRSGRSAGVIRSASRYSAVASRVAPRTRAAPAASARAWATDSSGPSAACPRCRARASGDEVAVARAAWARRSSAAGTRPRTAWAIRGWLNRTVPCSIPTRSASTAGSSAAANPGRARSSVSVVGSAAAAARSMASRAPIGSAATRPAINSPSESGIGSGTGGFDGSMSAGRARPISRAYNGLPPDAASTLTSTSRGSDRPSRSPSTWCRAASDSGPSLIRSVRSGPTADARSGVPGSTDPVRTETSRPIGRSARRRTA